MVKVIVETNLESIPTACYDLTVERYFVPTCHFYNGEYDYCVARTDESLPIDENDQCSYLRTPTWCPLRLLCRGEIFLSKDVRKAERSAR